MSVPRWWRVLRMRLRSLLRPGRVESDLEKELRFHLDQEAEERRVAGLSRVEAHYAAMRRLGGVAQIQEECRDMRRTQYIENLWQDVRYAARTMAKNPVFSVVMILTLALSIGANSAIFSVIDGVMLRPLPYPGADHIVRFFHRSDTYPKFPLNPYDFRDLRERNRSLDALAAYTRADLQLSGEGRPVMLSGFRVTAGYFRVLGIAPARGREFDSDDERPGADNSVILSDRLWRNTFHATPDIVGRKIVLNSRPFTVAGVMPPGVDHPGNNYNPVAYGDSVDVWWPFTFNGNPNSRGSHYIEGIARLKQGVSVEQARTDLESQVVQLRKEHPGEGNWHALLIPLYGEIVGPVQRLLLLLLGAVGLVLLIACANAANLLLARAASRQREMAVRTALGAARGRLMRQMFAESLSISLIGGLLGAALAGAGVRALVALLPAGFPRAAGIHVNSTMLLFALAISMATGLLFGLAPALQAARSDPQTGLREGGRTSSGSRRQSRLRGALVIGEIALACVLLIGAGLLLRSFVNLLRSEPGFRPEHVLTAQVSLPGEYYKDHDAVARFFRRLTDEIAALPNVQSAGAGSDVPWTGYDDNVGGFTIEGKSKEVNDRTRSRYHFADRNYFRTLGIPLLRGRSFEERDVTGLPVIIVNRSMARQYWPGEDAIGRRITFNDEPKKPSDWFTVVGVVQDVKDAPSDVSTLPSLWWDEDQPAGFGNLMSVVVRSNADAAANAVQLQNVLQRLDPNLALAHVRPMEDIAHAGFDTQRFSLFLVALFAALALVLAAIGVYGIISYSVGQRTHEFGMRMALGASPAQVRSMVMRQGFVLAAAGVALGLGGALALGRALSGFLYEVKSWDPVTLIIVSGAALVTAALASYPSARKATGADPIQALRAD